jgi:AraC family transcriptional regulator, regulatory protein of adaptative response / DNA-3-methyladenine glycosylase II
VSLGAARTVLGRIAARYGRAVRHWSLRAFPRPDALAGADPASLPMPRRRAEALVALSEAVASGAIALHPGAPLDETRAALLALPGIGDWTASYIAMRALADPDAFPAGDLALRRAVEAAGSPDPARWRSHRAYAAQHLWTALAARPPG